MPEPDNMYFDPNGAMDPLSSLSSADVSLPFSSLGSSSQDKQTPSPTASHNIRPNTLNTTADTYWFAHAADPPQDRVSLRHNATPVSDQEELESGLKRLDDEISLTELETASGLRANLRGRGVISPSLSDLNVVECKDENSPISQKEREDRFRQFKERQEEERVRRLQDLKQQSFLAQKFREQQEDERRRKIEELRHKDQERRMAVEERKRLIWEAEQERKEAILRRNLEREAKIEARRNAHRNSMSFAFGSSTPRLIDLDLTSPYTSKGSPTSPCGSTLLSPSINGREGEMYKKRNPSGDDPMTRSMVILPSARGRRKTDLTPTIPWERDASMRSHSPASSTGGLSIAKRAVSMSRLDILAQPRRRYLVEHSPSSSNLAGSAVTSNTPPKGGINGAPGGPRTPSSSMSKSMLNLANPYNTKRLGGNTGLKGPPRMVRMGSGSSGSMLYISSSGGSVPPSRVFRSSSNLQPSSSTFSSTSRMSPTYQSGFPLIGSLSKNLTSDPCVNKRMSKSMTHLALNVRPPPRPTRASRLRVTNAALAQQQQDGRCTSNMALEQIGIRGTSSASETMKDSPSSSRPRSSMSGASEISVASTVSMRSQSGPRRPRPVSMVGAIPMGGQQQQVIQSQVPTPPQRQSRAADRKGAANPSQVSVSPPRPPRAKPSTLNQDQQAPPKPPPRKSTASPRQAPPRPTVPPPDRPIASVQPNNVEPQISLDSESVPSNSLEKPESEDMISPEIPVASSKPEEGLSPTSPVKESSGEPLVATPQSTGKPRITSEEEAKAALAEKRRLAREQADREAELERLRLEELERQEKERLRKEEEEQKRFEEEQLRLASELRRQEEEKLEKAIKEQEQREEAEKLRQEEEAKLKVEREEQEKKAKEEAEKQRQEMEEKLKKEEADRAERKKRVEQIMKRTRGKSAAQTQKDGDQNSAEEQMNPVSASQEVLDQPTSVVQTNGETNSEVVRVPSPSESENVSNQVLTDNIEVKKGFVEPNAESDKTLNGFQKGPSPNESQIAKTIVNSEEATVMHTNGFSSPEQSFSEGISPEEVADPVEGNLLNFDSMGSTNSPVKISSSTPAVEFDQLIDLSLLPTTTTSSQVASNENEVNLKNGPEEDLNSNRFVSNNPFIAFEDNATKKQESTFTDLLS